MKKSEKDVKAVFRERYRCALNDLCEEMLCDPATDIADILLKKLSADDIVKLKSWFDMERRQATLNEWRAQEHRIVR